MPEIQYDSAQHWVLNAVLALMILGLALDIHPRDFTRILKKPKAPILGLLAQFLLLPAFTCLLTLLLAVVFLHNALARRYLREE